MDPFTIAAGIGAVGSLFGGLTSFFGGQARKKLEEQNANQADAQAGVNAQLALRQGDSVEAEGAVRAAANGGGLVGSSMGVIGDLANQSMFNARQQIYRGQTEAQSDRYQGEVAQAQGMQGLIGGVVGGASSLAGGMMKSAQFGMQQQALTALRGDAGYGMGW